MSFGFLRRTILPFSKIARNICDWCGLTCPEDPDLEGVCCKDGNGTFLTQEECLDVAGEWIGPDKSLNDCKLGACCEVVEGEITGNCAVLTREDCKDKFKSAWQGAGTNCEGRDCAEGGSIIDCFRIQSTNACKCGFGDYAVDENGDPTTGYDATRRWRKKVLIGSQRYQSFVSSSSTDRADSCDGGNDCNITDVEFSGTCYGSECGFTESDDGTREVIFTNYSGFFPDGECIEDAPSSGLQCNISQSGGPTSLATFSWTATSRSITGTGACNGTFDGTNSFGERLTGTVTESLIDEDTIWDAIARAQTDPECPREDCDREEFQGCERCEYDPDATDCWKETRETQPGSCIACTDAIDGVCYNASVVRLYVSIRGNSGGTVYAIFRTYVNDGSYDPDDDTTYTDIPATFVIDAAGPDDATTCIIYDLEAAEGSCIFLLSHSTTPPPE